MRNVLFVLLAVLVIALPAQAADICIAGSPDVCYSTNADENAAGLYYQTQYDDALCQAVGVAAGCSAAEYAAACALEETPDCETFYARTAQGAKEFFMDTVIKSALSGFVVGYENDIDTRARDYWQSLSLADKQTQCTVWGFDATCLVP